MGVCKGKFILRRSESLTFHTHSYRNSVNYANKYHTILIYTHALQYINVISGTHKKKEKKKRGKIKPRIRSQIMTMRESGHRTVRAWRGEKSREDKQTRVKNCLVCIHTRAISRLRNFSRLAEPKFFSVSASPVWQRLATMRG